LTLRDVVAKRLEFEAAVLEEMVDGRSAVNVIGIEIASPLPTRI